MASTVFFSGVGIATPLPRHRKGTAASLLFSQPQCLLGFPRKGNSVKGLNFKSGQLKQTGLFSNGLSRRSRSFGVRCEAASGRVKSCSFKLFVLGLFCFSSFWPSY